LNSDLLWCRTAVGDRCYSCARASRYLQPTVRFPAKDIPYILRRLHRDAQAAPPEPEMTRSKVKVEFAEVDERPAVRELVTSTKEVVSFAESR
jgi:hypothetical protein